MTTCREPSAKFLFDYMKKVGYIGFTDSWGDQNYNALVQLAAAKGITVTTNERYNRVDTSVTAQALKILATKPDALYPKMIRYVILTALPFAFIGSVPARALLKGLAPWEYGLVFSFPMFQHRGGSGTIKISNVPGVDSLPLGGSSSNLQAGEIFKIDHGRITAVEAMGASLPYGTKSGWGE